MKSILDSKSTLTSWSEEFRTRDYNTGVDFINFQTVKEAIWTHVYNTRENLDLTKIDFNALEIPLSKFIYRAVFDLAQYSFLWNEFEANAGVFLNG